MPGPDTAVVSIKTPGRFGKARSLIFRHSEFSTPNEVASIRLYQNNLLVLSCRAELLQGLSNITFPNLRAEGRMDSMKFL